MYHQEWEQCCPWRLSRPKKTKPWELLGLTAWLTLLSGRVWAKELTRSLPAWIVLIQEWNCSANLTWKLGQQQNAWDQKHVMGHGNRWQCSENLSSCMQKITCEMHQFHCRLIIFKLTMRFNNTTWSNSTLLKNPRSK